MGFPTKRFEKNETIFEEGDKARVAYILKEGCVGIFNKVDERKALLAALNPGAIFGEMALLLKEKRRTATAVALEDSVVVLVDSDSFEKSVEKSPTIIVALLNTLTERLRKTTAKARSGDLFLCICEFLNFLNNQQLRSVDVTEIVDALSRILQSDSKELMEKLTLLETFSLIKIENDQVSIVAKDDFLNKAHKIHGVLQNLGAQS